jgi:DHA1 family bicyclomycin/chloramphenicol resistance-like MFS transporter
MVIPRAIIRDWFTGTEATRLMALVMLVISVSPMLAPLAGSMIILVFDWRAIFVILGLAAVASLVLVLTALPETLPPEHRAKVSLNTLRAGAKRLMSDTKFLCLTFLGGFGMASFFVFIASASFVYTGEFGLSPTQFSLAFAVNAAGFFGASQFAAFLGGRFGAPRVIAWAASGFALFTVLLLALALAGLASLPVIVLMLLLANACLGLVIPTTMVLALDDQGDIAGLASSMGGTLQMLTGSAMIALASPFFDGTALPMVAAIAICGAAVFTLSRFVLRQSRLGLA